MGIEEFLLHRAEQKSEKRGEKRGEKRQLIQVICTARLNGLSVEMIAHKIVNLTVEEVQAILKKKGID